MQWSIQGVRAVGVCAQCLTVYGPTDESRVDSIDAEHRDRCAGQPPAGMSAAAKRRAKGLLSGNY